ncbi:MAG: hypothetical protein HYU77_15675 [Betaproteobacteria bacterium]|nr:hypothetical protein [Betaproteobacteria bacterium]
MNLAIRWILIVVTLVTSLQGAAAMAMNLCDIQPCHHDAVNDYAASPDAPGTPQADDSGGFDGCTLHSSCVNAALPAPISAVSIDAAFAHSAAPVASRPSRIPDRPKRPPLA